MKVFNPEKELRKIQKGNRNKTLYGIIALLLIISIGSTYALYQVRYSKRIIYTKVAPFSNKDLDLAVYVNGKKQSEAPNKESGYKYAYIECDNGEPTAEWDEENWNFKQISNINIPNKCNVYFSEIIQEFEYTQSIQQYTIPKDGIYKLEVWGAQGGNGYVAGGLGGYSSGELNLKSGNTLYIVVGGAGAGNKGHAKRVGGYNGGGTANSNSDSNTRQASGGGATHIATITGLLKDLVNNKDSILIVAGGGGGAGVHTASVGKYITYVAGSGGGLTGGDGEFSITSMKYVVTGGTQLASGVCTYATDNSYCDSGSFGVGANSLYNGGGGGYFGGGAALECSSGGSGYLKQNLTKTRTINGTNYGNGKARISYLSPN